MYSRQMAVEVQNLSTFRSTHQNKEKFSLIFPKAGRTELCRKLLLKYAPYLKATLENKLILHKYL
jgi:hypothetical protein